MSTSNSLSPHTVKWATLGRVLLYCVGCAITLALTSGITKGMSNNFSSYAALLLAIIITIGLTLLFVRWEQINLNDIGMMPGKYTISRVVVGFIIGLAMAVLQPLILILFNSHIHLALSPKIAIMQVIDAFILYMLIAIREEIAFRAYPLRSLDRMMASWVALAIVLIIFSLEHILGGMTWVQAFLGAGVGSILFGVAALSTKGLAMPVGLHIAWNFGQWLVGFKDDTGIWRAVVDKGYEQQVQQMGLCFYLLVMALGISGFYVYWRKKKWQPDF
jgi:membrane protease YdiL (CAAX protease family)